jgi:hypothetical protein
MVRSRDRDEEGTARRTPTTSAAEAVANYQESSVTQQCYATLALSPFADSSPLSQCRFQPSLPMQIPALSPIADSSPLPHCRFQPSPPWGRGCPAPALSSAGAGRVRGSRARPRSACGAHVAIERIGQSPRALHHLRLPAAFPFPQDSRIRRSPEASKGQEAR